MTDFVEACRREWARLRVPAHLADEMAADLAADLRAADEDGESAEALLGTALLNPRAFAESWARERGLVSPRPYDRFSSWRAGAVVGALVVFAAALVITIALLAGSSDNSRQASAVVPPMTSGRVMVPNLIGIKRGEAFAAAGAAGLRFAIRYRAEAGPSTLDVVAQSPAAGVIVGRGSTLLIVVRR